MKTFLLAAFMVLGSSYGSTAMGLSLSSPEFNAGDPIPMAHTCQGQDTPPTLRWSGVPKGSKSLALIVDDPDAPSGTWTHWVVYNISPTSNELSSTPVQEPAIEGNNSWGKNLYRGPCPPQGTHRYVFTLYALDTLLSLPPGANASLLREAFKGHILAQAELVGIYSKQLNQ